MQRLLAAFLTSVLGLGMFMAPLAEAATCDGSEFVRFVSYNIRLDTPADGENRWQMRREFLVSQIELARPQVLGLQEVLPGQKRDLAAQLPRYAVIGGGRDDGEEAGEASSLLIDRQTFAVGVNGLFWLSPTPDRPSKGWDAAYPRIATWARLRHRASGTRLLVVNTHWDHFSTLARLESARLLREWIAGNARRGEKVVLIGDFNAPVGEASLGLLLASDGQGAGLRDARAIARKPPVGPQATFNGFDPFPPAGEAIDHILVGEGLGVERVFTLAQHFGPRLASDHFPVIADVLLGRGCE